MIQSWQSIYTEFSGLPENSQKAIDLIKMMIRVARTKEEKTNTFFCAQESGDPETISQATAII